MSTLYVDNLQPNLGSQVSIPNLQPIAGQTIQTVTVNPAIGVTNISANTWTEVSSSFRLSITPKSSSSTLLLTCTFAFGGRNTSNIQSFKFYDVTNSADVNLHTGSGSRFAAHGSIRQVDSDSNDIDNVTLSVAVSSGSTTARTYGLYTTSEPGFASVEKTFFGAYNDASQLSVIRPIFVVQEIAQ